jgi:hypothetical protein
VSPKLLRRLSDAHSRGCRVRLQWVSHSSSVGSPTLSAGGVEIVFNGVAHSKAVGSSAREPGAVTLATNGVSHSSASAAIVLRWCRWDRFHWVSHKLSGRSALPTPSITLNGVSHSSAVGSPRSSSWTFSWARQSRAISTATARLRIFTKCERQLSVLRHPSFSLRRGAVQFEPSVWYHTYNSIITFDTGSLLME